MNTEKVGAWIKYVGLIFVGVILAVIVWSSIYGASMKKPLNKGEEKHWQDPSEQSK